MGPIAFSKLSGSGNDFILIDNRDGRIPVEELSETARLLCRRRFSVGADGLIAIDVSDDADFRWHFFNADGSSAEMCGNGGRCAARYALELGIAPSVMHFETLAGLIRAEVNGRRVKLELPPPGPFSPGLELATTAGSMGACAINTSVPHVVLCVDDIEHVPVHNLGRDIRFYTAFAPAGTNVNFICRLQGNRIAMRTYERGVEGETMACGTGAAASACTASHLWGLASPVDVVTRGGEVLTIHFEEENGEYRGLFLEGETSWIYDATYTEEALACT